MVTRYPDVRFRLMWPSIRLVALVAALQLAAAYALAQEDSSPELVERWHNAVNAYDVERSASLFADDAVVVQPRVGGLPQIYVGLEQIQWWHRGLVGQHVQFQLVGAPRRAGTHVRWTDHFSVDAFRDLGLDAIDIDSDAVLAQDGHIQSLISVLTPEAARSLQSAPGAPTRLPDASEQSRLGTLVLPALLVVAGFLCGAGGVVLFSRVRIVPRSRRLRSGHTRNGIEVVAGDPR